MERGFLTILKFAVMFFANPSLDGRGCPSRDGRPGEGYTMKKYLLYPSPGPLTRATLFLQERDFREYIFQF
jgi:hypothetical protein